MESGSVRTRRPASPPLSQSQRFPHQSSKELLGADERRQAASKGGNLRTKNQHIHGGLRLTSGEWKLLAFVMFIAAGVRYFRLSRPNSVV